jgi:hypothetical protein
MDILPKSTHLGKLNITEVYEAYDEPCLFACENASGQIFLAVLVDENEDCKKWLYVSLSKKRFEYIRSGGIDLYDSFRQAENETAYIVEVPLEENNSRVSIISCNDLTGNMLPFPGEFIKLQTQTLPILSNDKLKEIALSLWREVLRFKVKFPEYTRNEAPIKSWGNILASFQEVVDSIGIHIERETTQRTKQKDIFRQTEILATGTSGGSYCVDLIASNSSNILRDSLIGKCIEKLFLLIESGEIANGNNISNISSPSIDINLTENINLTDEEFSSIINTLGRAFASKYRTFLNCVVEAKSDIYLDWGSPNPEKGGSTTLRFSSAINTLYLINQMEISIPEIRELNGVLIGGNIESRKFEIRDISDGIKYKGEIALLRDTDMTLENIYNATIEETIEFNKMTKLTNLKYKLLKLEPLKLEPLKLEPSDSK